MNCGLLSDNHTHSPCQRIHIKVLHFVSWLAFELLSQVRVDSLEVWNDSMRYATIIQPLRVVPVVDFGIFSGKFPCTFLKTLILVCVCTSFLARSLIIASVSHTWELDAEAFWFETQVAGFPAHWAMRFDPFLTGCSEYPRATGWTWTRRCRRARRKNARPSSTSASTLPESSLLLFLVAFFSTSIRGSLLSWKCWYWTDGEDSSTYHVWNCPLWACLRVGFCCQHIWFGFWGPSGFCQITNRAQPCGNGIRVSLLDFCPWWSSWSLFPYLQKCRASHQIEKTSRWRKHIRCCMIQDRCTELDSELFLGLFSWCVMQQGFPAHRLWMFKVGWKNNTTLQ